MTALVMDISIICQAGFSIIPTLADLWEIPAMTLTAPTSTMAGAKERQKAVLRERVAARLEALPERSQRDVSLAIGANQGYVRDLLDPEKTSIPGGDRLARLAAELETTTEYLLGKVETPDQLRTEVSFHEMPQEWRGGGENPTMKLVHTAHCADLIIEEDGRSVEIERIELDVEHTIRLVSRPAALWNAHDAYVVLFQGSSMERRYYQGDPGFVDPRRPPSPGQVGLFQLSDGHHDGVVCALAKELVSINSTEVVLRQYNPEITFRIPRRQIVAMHRIFRPDELVFL